VRLLLPAVCVSDKAVEASAHGGPDRPRLRAGWRSAGAAADLAPAARCLRRRGRPPRCARPPTMAATHVTVRRAPGRVIPRFAAWSSFRALLRDAREQCPNLCLPVPAVTAKGTDGGQFPGLGPPRDGLWVNPEHGRDLCWGQQRLGLWRTCRHVDGLSSWTGTAILRFLLWMSLMVYSDHIAITSGDKSTTRSQRFSSGLP
jgi:hypothetical protein